MFNFFKMDLRRLLRSVSFYVIIGLLLFIFGMNVYSDYRSSKAASDNNYSNYYELQKDDIDLGAVSSPDFTYDKYVSDIYSQGSVTILLIILVSLFVCSEYQSGYIKNIARITKHRWYNVASKISIALFIEVLMNIIACGLYYIGIRYIYPNGSVGDMGLAMQIIAIQMLVQFAILTLVILISTLFRSKALSITVGMLFVMQMIAFPVISLICKLSSLEVDDLYKYLLSSQMQIVKNSASSTEMNRAITVGIICFVAFAVLSCYTYRKRDI